MFNNFYSSEALPVDFDKKRIPQDKWTPAEVVQVQPSQAFKSTSLDVSFHFLKINGILLKKHIFKTIKLQNQVFLNNMGNPNGGLETLCGGNPGLETLTTPVIKVHLLFNSSLKS